MPVSIYDITRRENEKYVDRINDAWGAKVAWIEDQEFTLPGGKQMLPVIVSRTVNGLVQGLVPPPFRASARRRRAK